MKVGDAESMNKIIANVPVGGWIELHDMHGWCMIFLIGDERREFELDREWDPKTSPGVGRYQRVK